MPPLSVPPFFAELIRLDLTTSFEDYVNAENAARKLKAYRAYIQFKLSKTRKDKARAKWQKLLDQAEADIEFLPVRGNTIKLSKTHHIKYNRIRIATIFSRAERANSEFVAAMPRSFFSFSRNFCIKSSRSFIFDKSVPRTKD